MRLVLLVLALVLMAGCAVAQQPLPPAPDWKLLEFLIGDWTASGGGGAGAGTGSFSFHTELQGRVLVRKNVADYPAQNGRPAYHHDDLMIVYANAQGQPAEAMFFDSEGHSIHYTVEGADGKSVRFVSDAQAGAPRFRLSYRLNSEKLEGQFEIAPPGKPDAFAGYLQWTGTRTRPAR